MNELLLIILLEIVEFVNILYKEIKKPHRNMIVYIAYKRPVKKIE